MRPTTGALLIAFTLLAQGPCASAQGLPVRSASPVITVSAHGEVQVVPDRVMLVLTVETRSDSAATAAAENANKQATVISALKALGVSESQIGTENYAVIPETRNDPQTRVPRIVSYRVSNSVRVDLANIADVGRVIDRALGSGANAVSAVQFYESDREGLYQRALAHAVTNARAEATAMASSLGGHLGALQEITTVGQSLPSPVLQSSRMALAVSPTPILPGQDTVRASVTARWTFVPRP